jgi:hypothetical protein
MITNAVAAGLGGQGLGRHRSENVVLRMLLSKDESQGSESMFKLQIPALFQ